MRGLGSGYTQILIDGERVRAGFSMDSLAPEQIERIEILRAPTAETGARAIAGTINIITRGGYTKRINDLRIGSSFENGRVQPGLSWSRNDTLGPLIYNYTLSASRQNRASDTRDDDHRPRPRRRPRRRSTSATSARCASTARDCTPAAACSGASTRRATP